MDKLKTIFLEDSDASLDFDITYSNKDVLDSIYQSEQKCGLSYGEIIFLEWLHNKKQSIKYPKYFEESYSIRLKKVINKLIEMQFIKLSSNKESLDSLKVIELKEILKKELLPVSGRKNELIERILEKVSEEKYSHYVIENSFIVTEKGWNIVDEYQYLIYAHKKNLGMVYPVNVILFVSKNNNYSNHMILKHIKLKEFQRDYHDNNFGLMSNNMTCIAIECRQNREARQAIVAHLVVFIIRMSGWSNFGSKYSRDNIYNFQSIGLNVLVSGKDYNLGDLEDCFNDAWTAVDKFLPKHYLGKQKTYELLWAYVDGNDTKILDILGPDNLAKRLARKDAEFINKNENNKQVSSIDSTAVDLCFSKDKIVENKEEVIPTVDYVNKSKFMNLVIGSSIFVILLVLYFLM